MTTPSQPTYNPNTPQRNTSFADWQINFQANFARAYNDFAKNHVPLDAALDAGNHTVMQLLEQSGEQQIGATELGMYSLDTPNQTSQIYLQNGPNQYQYTNYQIYSIAPSKSQTYNFTFLPGGLLVMFGLFTRGTTNVINLYPTVAKNIVAINTTCAGGANYPGATPLQKNSDGIITGLILTPFGQTRPPSQYYFVVANV